MDDLLSGDTITTIKDFNPSVDRLNFKNTGDVNSDSNIDADDVDVYIDSIDNVNNDIVIQFTDGNGVLGGQLILSDLGGSVSNLNYLTDVAPNVDVS